MASEKQKRSRRGGVSVTVRSGILRLRWQYAGKRHHLSLGIPDNPSNRQIAAQKAAQLESDIIGDLYDPTLDRYRVIRAAAPLTPTVSTVALFEQFTEMKRSEGVSAQALATKYSALRSNIARLGHDVATVEDARELVQLLRARQSPLTANQNLILLKSFGKWLCENAQMGTNLFESIKPQKGASIKVQDRTPFTRDELSLFLETMRSHPTASHYYDFTVVLFSLGLRPSEAIGLRWRHINMGRREITIRESLSRAGDGKSAGKARQRKGTKTGNVRILPLNDRLIDLFTARWYLGAQPDELIFSASDGGPIDDRNYRVRYWRMICEQAGIPYRPPYTARHTMISYGLEYGGWTERQAAFMAGHTSTRMISETYGHLMERPELPDLGE